MRGKVTADAYLRRCGLRGDASPPPPSQPEGEQSCCCWFCRSKYSGYRNYTICFYGIALGVVTRDVISGGRAGFNGVVEFAMHDDDWEVTRHHLLRSPQPRGAEQIGCCCWFCRSKMRNHTVGRYGIILFARGIALGGDSDARRVTSQ